MGQKRFFKRKISGKKKMTNTKYSKCDYCLKNAQPTIETEEEKNICEPCFKKEQTKMIFFK